MIVSGIIANISGDVNTALKKIFRMLLIDRDVCDTIGRMENTETEMNEFWTEEFAPKTIDEMVLTEDLKTHFKNLIGSKNRFNILLSGSPGIGKSTLAGIIAKELNASVLFLKCGLEGNVDTAKTKLTRFCNAMSIDGRPKVVILDELDSASGTQDNSFQKVLRNIISDSPDTMFIGTCNYAEKVISPIKSRMNVVSLKFTGKELYVRIKEILDAKNVSYTIDDLKLFATEVIKSNYPDIRAIISILSTCCSTGRLVVSDKVVKTSANTDFMKQIVEMSVSAKNMLDVRKFYIQNKSKISDYMSFSSELFSFVMENGYVTDNARILKLVDLNYQMNVVVDKEITFFGMLTVLNGAR